MAGWVFARAYLGYRVSTYLYLRPWLVLLLLLGPPLLWMVLVYLGSLASLLVNSFFHLDDYTGLVIRQFTLRTYLDLFSRANMDIVLRTSSMAAAVSVATAVLAFPLAYYMARYASRVTKVGFTLASCCRSDRAIWCGCMPGN